MKIIRDLEGGAVLHRVARESFSDKMSLDIDEVTFLMATLSWSKS